MTPGAGMGQAAPPAPARPGAGGRQQGSACIGDNDARPHRFRARRHDFWPVPCRRCGCGSTPRRARVTVAATASPPTCSAPTTSAIASSCTRRSPRGSRTRLASGSRTARSRRSASKTDPEPAAAAGLVPCGVVDSPDPMTGATVVVTGANAGVGLETAAGLVALGARVVLTARDEAKGANAADRIRARGGPGTVDVAPLDLASFASIRRFAREVAPGLGRLDVLVNNAGLVQLDYTVTEDGFETTFGVNHLGHFLLTTLLLDQLRSSTPARVVVVASVAHRSARSGLDFDDLQAERGYSPIGAYNRSKLANIYFTRELARRLAGSGVTANSLHPGFVASRLGRDGDGE